ncbi:MAG: outer membrane lipoprotein carrier protein LolA [Bacteroidales bacterium]|nr:outer membrane lipoprotein carrier protein LolA [Bacteroidales bacterium]
MKNILKYLLCAGLMAGLPLSVLTSSVQAQITHSGQGAVDQKADALLKRAAGQFGNVSFNVTATMLDAQKKETLRQKAKVLYCKGCYHVTVADQEVFCDGKTVWQWNKTAGEVMVTNMGSDDVDLMNPARLLKNYDKSFRAKYIRTDEGVAVVDLQPRSARSFHKIRLFVSEKSGMLMRLEVHKYDSSREVYEITEFNKAHTPASQFTFDAAKHAGVELIDMR